MSTAHLPLYLTTVLTTCIPDTRFCFPPQAPATVPREIPPELEQELFSRNRYFFEDGFDCIKDAFVIVVGLGGVGSHAAHMLVRVQLGHVCLSGNTNVSSITCEMFPALEHALSRIRGPCFVCMARPRAGRYRVADLLCLFVTDAVSRTRYQAMADLIARPDLCVVHKLRS